jgi:glycyl-tRNA synthetase beta chain
MPDFLLEIGTEEIPARMIDSARQELARRAKDLLSRERLAEAPEIESFSTPRRIAVLARNVAAKQPDAQEQLTGPSFKVAFKDGVATPAAEAFAKKAGVPVASLEKVTTPKGEYLSATVQKKGRAAGEILAESLPKEITGIYWAKSMYWRGKTAERFVRPVRWIVSLLDDQVIPVEFGGITASHTSEGHRILSSGAVEIAKPADYATKLAEAKVAVSAKDREHTIRKALDAATRTIPGARWREDKPLLDTVVNLTEFPSVILGSFDPEFLTLPQEVLVTVMRDHQKYFAIEDSEGGLSPHFLAVLNTDSDPDGLIRHGNERVLRARFNDARFFWNTDQKINLRERVEMLKSVTFQKDLASYYDKTCRVQRLGSLICAALESAGVSIRSGVVHKAALLCKADLTTDLVKEFTELQGIIGGLYAKVQDLDSSLPKATADAIGDAIYHHYQPDSMDDAVPPAIEGSVLAIADKADSIAGMFALGLEPTGSKDPFALRRAANGIVKILAEKQLPLPLNKLAADALLEYKGSDTEKKFAISVDDILSSEETAAKLLRTPGQSISGSGTIMEFMYERLEFYLRDVRGFEYDLVKAVLSSGGENIPDALARVEALSNVRGSEDFASVAYSFKRMRNILRQALTAKPPVRVAEELDTSLLTDDAEKALAALIPTIATKVRDYRKQRNYTAALTEISVLRVPVDTFFDKVMVMAEDERIRGNRLALLRTLLNEFSTIADFSEIVTEAK